MEINKIQEGICEKFNAEFFETDFSLKIGITENLLSEKKIYPINGLRHNPVNNTSGWYIWSGEFLENEDFFKTLHISHLTYTLPTIIKYMALPPGYRFLIDDKGYEDVWYDETLLID